MLVSIIIPVYNSEKYLKRCLDSLLEQSYQNFEIITIDDGSNDNSLSVLKSYKKNYSSKIKVITQKNSGVAFTRNKGILESKGKYITFIDNDDYVEKDFLRNLIENAKSYDVVVGGYKRVTNSKILFAKKIKKGWGKYENVAPWGKLIKREYILENNIKFFSYPIGEDIIFSFDLYSFTDKINVISTVDYNWFYNENSVSNTIQKKFVSNILKLMDEMKCHDKNKETAYFIGRYYVWYLLFCGKTSSPKQFLKEHNKIKKWLINNNYYKELSFVQIIKNEKSIKNIIIVLSFYYIVKFHLLKIFSKLYCKGCKK